MKQSIMADNMEIHIPENSCELKTKFLFPGCLPLSEKDSLLLCVLVLVSVDSHCATVNLPSNKLADCQMFFIEYFCAYFNNFFSRR